MRYVDVITALHELKNTGAWKEVCDQSGVRPDTLSRIYRKAIPNPGVLTIERIADAIKAYRWKHQRQLPDASVEKIHEFVATANDDTTLDQLPRDVIPTLCKRCGDAA